MSSILMIFKQEDYNALLKRYPKKWVRTSDLDEFYTYSDQVVLFETSYSSSSYDLIYDVLNKLEEVSSDTYTTNSLFTKYACTKGDLRTLLNTDLENSTKQVWSRILDWLDTRCEVSESKPLYLLME